MGKLFIWPRALSVLAALTATFGLSASCGGSGSNEGTDNSDAGPSGSTSSSSGGSGSGSASGSGGSSGSTSGSSAGAGSSGVSSSGLADATSLVDAVTPLDAKADAASGLTGDAASCGDAFLALLDKMCTMDSDCTTADHDDCCGTVVVGIRVGTQATFTTAEQAFITCESGCGARGCDHATLAEIGQASSDASTIVVHCDAGACMTSFQ